MAILDQHRADLAALATRGRLRRLIPRAGVDLASNDYLGLAQSATLADSVAAAIARGVPVGSGGSRLLRGNHAEHEALEAEAAAFFGSESALFFSSGYGANATLLSALPRRGDLIVHDALIHASVHEGLRSGRADRASAAHNDVQAFADAIAAWRAKGGKGRVWIAIESLYSMDGDTAPIADFMALADAHDAFLLIDEAHATGALGPDGRGLAAGVEGRDNVITLRTCGKALGCEGALVCGPRLMTDYLVNRGRGFIFSTAPSPLMAAAVRAAIAIVRDEPERRARLMALIAHAAASGLPATGSQIIPIIIGDDKRTMAIAAALQEQGFDVRGIRPPTVPAGTARLRVSLTLNATPDDVTALAQAIRAQP
ncbi:8-amino-7-oxononanoate synthase [Sphingomonas laterariae]|uniref:8-amino-7-oxononanoate synthase n=1 Tax=Edaphosphingomonas laterariae TaxID=861865 RepID=A0A239C7Z0_9SPHN|nr:8-amino-7-oxononanoate synthase [Sphingomonas laterariae]SNS15503.1 8-amino-7-oxononanoate synthase [Sphingomonas laterariae]